MQHLASDMPTKANAAALLFTTTQHLGGSVKEHCECHRKAYLAEEHEGLLSSFLAQVLMRPVSCCCWSCILPSSRLEVALHKLAAGH